MQPAQYDKPQKEGLLAEQSRKLVHGLLVLVLNPDVRVDNGLPSTAIEALRACLAGKLDSTDLVAALKVLGQSVSM